MPQLHKPTTQGAGAGKNQCQAGRVYCCSGKKDHLTSSFLRIPILVSEARASKVLLSILISLPGKRTTHYVENYRDGGINILCNRSATVKPIRAPKKVTAVKYLAMSELGDGAFEIAYELGLKIYELSIQNKGDQR
jgi:hypothetical protein